MEAAPFFCARGAPSVLAALIQSFIHYFTLDITLWLCFKGGIRSGDKKMDQSPEAEFAAIQTVHAALQALDAEARLRVLAYVNSLFGAARPSLNASMGMADSGESGAIGRSPHMFSSFAELFDAAQPVTAAQKALVAGFWVQVCEGADSFDSQRLNTELKNLGHGVANITVALDNLKNQAPALALQLKKSGTTRQARKTYKITVAGENAVKQMINGSAV